MITSYCALLWSSRDRFKRALAHTLPRASTGSSAGGGGVSQCGTWVLCSNVFLYMPRVPG